MLAAIVAVASAFIIALHVKASFRFVSFVVLVLVMMPSFAYIIAGLRMVLSQMTGNDILQDFLSIASQCYAEPFRLALSMDVGRPLNPAFVASGTLVILATLISFGQFMHYLSVQRDRREPKRH